MFIEPKTAIEVGLAVWEKRGPIAKGLNKIRLLLKRGRLRIAIFGPGGTGKTTLGQILSGKFDTLKGAGQYKESIHVEEYPLQGDLACTLIVPPGQEFRRKNLWTDLYKSIAQGKTWGIINVVAWGHHSLRDLSYKETKYYVEGMQIGDFFNKYKADCLTQELNVINELIPRLEDAPKVWMITLVTKQDLWWKNRNEVKKYYEEGPYNEAIEKIRKKRGENNFRHDYLSVSLALNNLVTGNHDEVLALTTEGYDSNVHASYLTTLFDFISGYANK